MKQTYSYQLNDPIRFGKHRGQTIRDLMDHSRQYVQWLLENVSSFALTEEAMAYYRGENGNTSTDEVEILDFFPFRDKAKARERYIAYARQYAEDVEIIPEVIRTQPIQLNLF